MFQQFLNLKCSLGYFVAAADKVLCLSENWRLCNEKWEE